MESLGKSYNFDMTIMLLGDKEKKPIKEIFEAFSKNGSLDKTLLAKTQKAY